MGVPGNADLLLLRTAAGAAATAGRSVRFNSADSAYLSRTPASAGNRKTWTWSGWVKRSKISNDYDRLFGSETSASTVSTIRITMLNPYQDCLEFHHNDGTNVSNVTTAAKLRDPSAWYHIVVSVDTTQSTSANRTKIYINKVEQTLAVSTYLNQNVDTFISSTNAQNIGRSQNYGSYFNGYLALVHFIDGQALTPSSFGETDATTGQWIAKTFSGSYGTNGFFLDFADNSTAAALGYDAAGSNDWTVNNLSVTAGSGNDSLRDHPTSAGTSTGAGGEVAGNYCVINPLGVSANTPTISDGNLQMTLGSLQATRLGTIGVTSGKWYWEIVYTAATAFDGMVGVARQAHNLSNYVGSSSDSWGYYYSGVKYNAASPSSYGNSWTTGDVIGVALDMDNLALYFSKNGTWQNSGVPTSGASKTGAAYTNLSGEIFPALNAYGGTQVANFGQRAFAYSAPSGFSPLVDTLLPTPTIAKPNTVMDVKLYTGNGSSQSITGLGFSPDLVWIKGRSGATDHALYDVVRGAEKRLESNNADAEVTSDGGVTAFNSDGFSLGTLAQVNTNSATYVGWTWDAGANSSKTYTVTVVSGAFYIDGKQQPTVNLEEGSTYTFDLSAASNSGHPLRLSTTVDGPSQYTTGVTTSGTAGNAGATLTIAVASGAPTLYYFCTNHNGMGGQINTNTTAGASNFAGTITSTVRANISAGFSVVTWTGTGSAGTIGHGLGVAPQMIIVKNRSTASDWIVGHNFMRSTPWDNYYLILNSTSAVAGTITSWGGSGGFTPTSSLFGVGSASAVNNNGSNLVAYCWTPVAGYSAFGSYTGNGSSDGPFVYTGFRPRWILTKFTDGLNHWNIYDAARNSYNVASAVLKPNGSGAETTLEGFDLLSNGFKARGTDSENNGSGDTFIYAAFAEAPFPYARAR